MLHKIKTLREIIEPNANKLGISFEEILEDFGEEERFDSFMKQYKRKLNPKNYEGMNYMSNIIRLTGDCKLIKSYLEKEYYIKDSKYHNQFIDYLSEIANTRPESIAYWRSSGMLSNKNELIDQYSSYEPYALLKYKDVSTLLETLNIKPIYHLNDKELSTLINDKEYETWLHSPHKYSTLWGDSLNRLNLKNRQEISQIYTLYLEYIVEKWITENIDPNSEVAKRISGIYGSYQWACPIIKHVIFENSSHFKRTDGRRSSYITPYTDYRFGDINYEVPLPSDVLELSILIEHFTEFKSLMNQLFTDKKIEELYYDVIELDKKHNIKPETTWDRALNQNSCKQGSAENAETKYLSYLWSLSMLDYYVSNPDELILYNTLEYPNKKEIPCMYDLKQVLNEKSYWSKSLKKWSETKYKSLVKKIKTQKNKAENILS